MGLRRVRAPRPRLATDRIRGGKPRVVESLLEVEPHLGGDLRKRLVKTSRRRLSIAAVVRRVRKLLEIQQCLAPFPAVSWPNGANLTRPPPDSIRKQRKSARRIGHGFLEYLAQSGTL